MQYGLYLPNYGVAADPRRLADIAGLAEKSGWDGFFLWDHILASKSQKLRIVDPWVALAAMAMTTSKIRLGTTVTPVPRRRPWVLARQTATLDQLSGGRVVLGVGLGFPSDTEYTYFGEPDSDIERAEKLDEGLAILAGLWRGKPFKFEGKHFKLEKMTFQPAPIQQPRIPVWVGGMWPRRAPFRRAARWDGAIPLTVHGLPTPQDIENIVEFMRRERTSPEPFDVAVVGTRSRRDLSPEKAAVKAREYAKAGATWWLESCFMQRDSAEELSKLVLAGPPRV